MKRIPTLTLTLVLGLLSPYLLAQYVYSDWKTPEGNTDGVMYRWKYAKEHVYDHCYVSFRDSKQGVTTVNFVADYIDFNSKDQTVHSTAETAGNNYSEDMINNCTRISSVRVEGVSRLGDEVIHTPKK